MFDNLRDSIANLIYEVAGLVVSVIDESFDNLEGLLESLED